LNTELAERRSITAVNSAAKDVADVWNNFVDVYFANKEIPKGVKSKQAMYQDAKSVILIMENILEVVPYLDILNSLPETLKKATGGPSIVNLNKKSSAATLSEFDKIMREFFEKNNI
jgi:hypothetical protein